MPKQAPKNVVISGGSTGMGRATALERLARGDRVTVIGSNPTRGKALLDEAANPRLRFVCADLSTVAEVDRVVGEITEQHDRIDALGLFANRVRPKRVETADGWEATFALYYLSRYLLGRRLAPLLDASPRSVIINVAGVGNTAGGIHWADPQLTENYGTVRAQLQAGRANDLLGVSYAENADSTARYVLYHPGFTKSGAEAHPSALVSGMIKVLGTFFARPVAASVRPIVEWIEHPPAAALTAVDRGKPVDPTLKTLDPKEAARLAEYTAQLLRSTNTDSEAT
ncbi:SDR family NAD(P)-dependent oxidoreductase [Actinoalloteichus hymeniacidonis]|uniref:Short chain dehydrogenase n=1 Tax=Actinoalloteichus hymeniacidonis TaxID=340345 RepID=A0AAC9MY82_9PSEU|nr:SDR family NAD(P)-dependent oxidoreductase [Actinoalloteichus hymeniacidonis]AOS64138.1 dehydrogenase of unknown specificity, short-chain alcohol dehydrogenase like [Actinoalloteichus hymeniacidonis]